MTSARPTGHQYHETILGISFKCNQPGLHQKSWRKANCENSRMFFFLNISYPCENSDWQGGGKYCDDFVSTKMFTMRKMSHRKCCNEQAVPVWAWTHLRGGQCGQWCHTGERRAPPTPHCHHSLTCPTTPHTTSALQSPGHHEIISPSNPPPSTQCWHSTRGKTPTFNDTTPTVKGMQDFNALTNT